MSVSLESIKSLSFILDVVEDVWRMFRGIYRPDLKYLIFTKQFRILHMICAFLNESFEKISILTNLKFETSAHAEDFFFPGTEHNLQTKCQLSVFSFLYIVWS